MDPTDPIRFFKQNWYNTISLLISLAAVFIALQANSYARRSSTPDLVVNRVGDSVWRIFADACHKSSRNEYELRLRSYPEYWISNNGGLPTALIDADFTSDFDSVIKDEFGKWSVSLYYSSPAAAEHSWQIPISPGASVRIALKTNSARQIFPTREAALSYWDSLKVNPINSEKYRRYGHWQLIFGNGTTQTMTTAIAEFYTTNDDLSKELDTPCESP
jgi:hypothetical protein